MENSPSVSVLTLQNVSKAFDKPSGAPLMVLADINVALHEGEILGLLGRSGSGKSTLLRIAAGLIAPSAGQVSYRGVPLEGPSDGIAVVFQTFALFPWLTVLENVEASLDALGLKPEEARRRALAAIELIGLDGFEGAYPRELSGGMRQRVGFARALVIDPTVLLMDEPFSALDVLTAETLRTDFIDLWTSHRLPTKAVLLVTHNIEEAVMMCDRILVLSPGPGRISAKMAVNLPYPRNRLDSGFREIVDELYATLVSRSLTAISAQKKLRSALAQPLPRASVNRISGLIEKLANPPCDGMAELAKLRLALNLQLDEFLAAAEALHILEFAELKEDTIRLTAAGRVFAEADNEKRKRIFREHLLNFVPLAGHIKRILDERGRHSAPRLRFETELEDHLSRAESERTLRTMVDWARYADLFSYDDSRKRFGTANPN
jgi:NitT/TauT family transport system ATP-binding protein